MWKSKKKMPTNTKLSFKWKTRENKLSRQFKNRLKLVRSELIRHYKWEESFVLKIVKIDRKDKKKKMLRGKI